MILRGMNRRARRAAEDSRLYAPWKNAACVAVPQWLIQKQKTLQSRRYTDDDEKLRLVLNCAKGNVLLRAGAPLAAAVFRDDGVLLSVAVDAPGMGGHEMSNALLLASNLLGTKVFRNAGDWDLFSLAPPCMVCQGNILSERPRRFIYAVTQADLLSTIDLPNTPFPADEWPDQLAAKKIKVLHAVARRAGKAILRLEPRSNSR
jgi:tRNA(Arg) A34 adenosine deaminase TadA